MIALGATVSHGKTLAVNSEARAHLSRSQVYEQRYSSVISLHWTPHFECRGTDTSESTVATGA